MNVKLRRLFKIVAAVVLTSAVHALPGVKQYIPDSSGEYVFYRDSSFKTETIVGFLYYNDSTYAARLYSPANAKAKSVEKDIVVYINIDPAKAGLELTGEKITGTVEGNSDLVNYLHDLLYEFTSRRQKIVMETNAVQSVKDDFLQFGGNVTVKYNPFIPVFNIEEICAADKNPVLRVETAGILSDSSDSSFTDFKGVNGLPKDKKRVFKKDKHSTEVEVIGGTQKITLDTQWQQSMENLWLLGDYALLSVNEMAMPKDLGGTEKAFDMLQNRFSRGTTHSYAVWQQSKITRTDKCLTIVNVFYQPDSGNVTRDFKVITAKSDGNLAMLVFTVFDGVYQKSRFYFDTILKSYRAE